MRGKTFVLTGGPHSGKTTLLSHLGNLGFQTVAEAAYLVTTDSLRRKSSLLPWIDRLGYQTAVLEKQLALESKLKPSPPAFLDRGVHDGLAYYALDGLLPPQNLLEAAKTHRYSGVFLLEEIEGYKKDAVRQEDEKQRKQLPFLFHKAYEEYGHEVIYLPAVSVEARAKIVLENI